ncbi:hypothetical protein IWW56_006340, partial [Coemansia sp. RSA 2131]
MKPTGLLGVVGVLCSLHVASGTEYRRYEEWETSMSDAYDQPFRYDSYVLFPYGIAHKETSMDETSSDEPTELGGLDDPVSSVEPTRIVDTAYLHSIQVVVVTETPEPTTVDSVLTSVVKETESVTVVVTSADEVPTVTETVT